MKQQLLLVEKFSLVVPTGCNFIVVRVDIMVLYLDLLIANSIFFQSTLLASGRSSANVENVMRILDLHLEDVGLDSSLAALKKEINKAKSLEDNKDLQMIVRKLGQVKHNIVSSISFICFLYILKLFRHLQGVHCKRGTKSNFKIFSRKILKKFFRFMGINRK